VDAVKRAPSMANSLRASGDRMPSRAVGKSTELEASTVLPGRNMRLLTRAAPPVRAGRAD